MDPFFLKAEPHLTGFTYITYDIGPAERATVVVPTIMAHQVLDIPAPDLLAGTLTDVRPPVRRRTRAVQ